MLKIDNSKYKIFTKTIWCRRATAYYILLVFTALSYSVLFNDVQIRIVSETISDKLLLMFVSFSYCLVLFYMLMLSRWVFIVATPLLFYVGSISYVYSTQLGFAVTAKTAPLFFSENVVNMIVSTPINAVAIVGFFVFALILGFIRFFFAKDTSVVRKGQAFALVVILLAGSTRLTVDKYDFFTPMPYSYISSLNKHFFGTISRIAFSKKRVDLESAETSYQDVKVVLILIEKLSDNFLKDEKNRLLTSLQGFTFLTDVPACSNDAETSVICSLTRATNDNLSAAIEEKSVTSLFNSAGFTTYWIVAHNMFSVTSPNAQTISKEADNYIESVSRGSLNPFAIVDDFNDAISSSGNSFIVIQTDGTTPYFGLRYSDIFNKHIPSCINRVSVFKSSERCVGDAAENSYKNYVNSLDAFIYEITKRVRDMKSIVIVAGMSGENTNAVNLYGENKFENKTIPIGVWVSNQLDEEYNLKNNVSENSKFKYQQSWLFHTIADCGGLKSDSIDKGKSLCNQ